MTTTAPRRGTLPPGAGFTAPFVRKAERAPAGPGAYVLVVVLRRRLTLTIPGHEGVVLPAGRYLYCGSAYGAGGLRARLGRHMRHGKSVRWHIDHLTEAGRVTGAWVLPGGNECALVAALSHLPVPLPGFGSSDCAICRSHLLHWPARAR
ncbi:GIY-YIG nuclease family protein [Rhodovastum atsumiense]|uniref:GIY-YIG nuclease family protein n=1 Tax=Rhodovastum atsumiense TaxID=504468 RepID=A0A5M6J104_9PROT|nr:GIY-YIG nuclease family protein [Rhodovastum atsumiense]KAA5614276.1 GIY-YIG nuclease family protein [Rhodovastum atsumiense]CAH2604730.1 GIY-YIG nuclease family protein [Rhodovastum atsumiense]